MKPFTAGSLAEPRIETARQRWKMRGAFVHGLDGVMVLCLVLLLVGVASALLVREQKASQNK